MLAWIETFVFIICAGGVLLIPTGWDILNHGFRFNNIAVGLFMIAYGIFCGFIALAGIMGY